MLPVSTSNIRQIFSGFKKGLHLVQKFPYKAFLLRRDSFTKFLYHTTFDPTCRRRNQYQSKLFTTMVLCGRLDNWKL